MTGKVTIEISRSFLEWWKTLAQHIQDDQTIMLVAWGAWQKAKEVSNG